MRLCVIFNPVAKGDKARKFRARLEVCARDCVLKPTTAPGSARALTAAAIGEGCDTILAAGGDGTINEVVNGMADVPDGLERVRLAVLPLGTANVFARELGVSLDLEAAWQVAQQGRERLVDLGQAEFTGAGRKHLFAQLGGAGLDARATELVSWNAKKRLGSLAYILAGFQALREPRPALQITAREWQVEGQLALVGNGRLYGGHFELFPGASLQDGCLHLTVYPRVSLGVVLRCLPGFLNFRFGGRGGARHYHSAAFAITGNASVPVELDGDVAGHLPARFTALPGRLRVLAP